MGLHSSSFESCLWDVPKSCYSLLFLLDTATYCHCLNKSLTHNRSKVGGKGRLGSGGHTHLAEHPSCLFFLVNIQHGFLVKCVWSLLPRFTVKQWDTPRVGTFGNMDDTARNQE